MVSHLDIQSFCILYPSALRKSILETGDRSQRCRSFSGLIFGISLPVQRCVRQRSVHLCQLAEGPGGVLKFLFFQRVSSGIVHLLHLVEALLLLVLLFLLALPFLLLAFAGFLCFAAVLRALLLDKSI